MYSMVYEIPQSTIIFFSVFALICYVVYAIGGWKMFEKAGEAGWKAIIPGYNLYIMFKISWMTRMFWIALGVMVISSLLSVFADNPMMYYFAMALNLVSTVINFVFLYNLSLSYGHGIGYFLGLLVFFPVFVVILGCGSSKYVGNRYQHGV